MIRILQGDCRDLLKTLDAGSVQCCVTSPPYWGLRDYGVDATIWGGDSECTHEWGDTITVNATNHTDKRRWNHTRNGRDEEQPIEKRVAWLRTKVPQGKFCQHCGAWAGALGLEPTPDLFIEHIVEVFREVHRVLRDDGVLLINLGDSFAAGHGGSTTAGNYIPKTSRTTPPNPRKRDDVDCASWSTRDVTPRRVVAGLKPKDLIGIPWMAAFALRADGWCLRRDIIWSKPNPMPESVTDRPTTAHEYVFLLTKSARYFWDAEAVREPCESGPPDLRKMAEALPRIGGKHKTLDDSLSKASAATNIGQKRSVGGKPMKQDGHGRRPAGFNARWDAAEDAGQVIMGRNLRSVWTIATSPMPEAHFATFPPTLAERCILAGTSEKGCCSACGAPWARVTTKGKPDMAHRRTSGADASGGYDGQSTKDHDNHGIQNASDVKRRILDGMREKTHSWSATCGCDAGVAPCVVLDCFGGAGTTGLIADRLGRDAVLIELNADYVDMARRRVTKDAGLFAEIST